MPKSRVCSRDPFGNLTEIQNLPYHGEMNRFQKILNFVAITTTSSDDDDGDDDTNEHVVVNEHGLILSAWDSEEKVLHVGGRDYGWTSMAPHVAVGYQEVVVPVGAALRFVYFVFTNVVQQTTLEAFEACDDFTKNAVVVVVGDVLDCPLTIVMDARGRTTIRPTRTEQLPVRLGPRSGLQ